MLTFLECSSTALRSVFKSSASLSELIVLKIMWGRHEFINDRNLGRRSIAFGKILQFGRWKILLLEFLTRESNSGHGGELESARS